ncbi:MAG: hypothetical protein HQM05_06935 [Magnetococcales bacterium]|nr:hypothetical protein [Magnetococcales bacterium]
MAAETMMFKLSGAAQAAQVPMLAGQTFTVGSTVATGDGMANWIFLKPVAGGGAENMVALKLEGARQSGQLTALVGKTVTVGKAPIGTAQAGKWLILHQGVGGAAVKGAAGTGVAMQQMGMRVTEKEMETAAAKASSGASKGAVGKGALGGACQVGGKGGAASAMAGKSVAVGKGASVGKGVVCANTGASAAGVTTLGGKTALGATGVAGAAVGATGAKGIAAGGTIWTGSGTSLGLGLGLGALGPILLVATIAAVGVGIHSYMKRPLEEEALEDAIS